MSEAIDAMRDHFNQAPIPKAKCLLDERDRVNAMIDAIEAENNKLRKLASEIGNLLFPLDVDYCVACPRDTINHPCPVHTLKGGECLYKTDLQKLGIELNKC